MELFVMNMWAKLADPGAIIAIVLLAMFLVLMLLTIALKIFGVGNPDDEEETVAPKAAPMAKAAAVAAPVAAPVVGNTETVRSKPDVDGGVPAETVAVISAAVASVAPAGSQYAVKGIRKL